MSDFAQTVKQQADIVKVIEGYIRLRKAGAQNYTGLCPFHKEKIAVVQRACGAAVLSLLWLPAYRAMCSALWGRSRMSAFPRRCGLWRRSAGFRCRSGSFLRRRRRPEARLRGKLLDLHEAATAWFEEQLRGPEGALAREYLAGRGLTPEGIKTFRIGYAPDSFQRAARPAERHGRRGDAAGERAVQLEGAGRRDAGADLRPLSQADHVSHLRTRAGG